jgi:transposase
MQAVFIKLTASRGKEVLENSPFGPDDILLVSDRYGAYNYFDRDLRQVCWAHLKREFTRLSHSRYEEISNMGMDLCDITSELFALKKSLLEGIIDKLYFLRRARKLRQRCWYCLKKVAYLDPSMRASKIASNIMKSEDMMWRFLYDPVSIPLTNNFAEQLIRHYVIYRKNSYFTQSERGNRFLERIISLYLTCKRKTINPFQHLLEIIQPKQVAAL